MLAARITGYGIYILSEEGSSLVAYGEMFRKEGALFHDDTEDERRFLYTDPWSKPTALPFGQDLRNLPEKRVVEVAGIYSVIITSLG